MDVVPKNVLCLYHIILTLVGGFWIASNNVFLCYLFVSKLREVMYVSEANSKPSMSPRMGSVNASVSGSTKRVVRSSSNHGNSVGSRKRSGVGHGRKQNSELMKLVKLSDFHLLFFAGVTKVHGCNK